MQVLFDNIWQKVFCHLALVTIVNLLAFLFNIALKPLLGMAFVAYVASHVLLEVSHIKWASNIEFVSIEYICIYHSGSNIFMTE